MKLRERPAIDSMIPTASMADIAFLLIVFFMVTTTFAATKGLALSLPGDDSLGDDDNSAVYINVREDGLFVDCQPVAVAELLPTLKPRLERWSARPVILHAEQDARYQQMVQAYDELAKAGDVLGFDISNVLIPTLADIDNYEQLFGYNPFAESCRG